MTVDYLVVFRDLPLRQGLFWRVLKPGFRHVEVWREQVPGAWLRFDTSLEFLSVELFGDPPEELLELGDEPTILHYSGVIAPGRIREPFFVGPITCVTLTAALLGVHLPFWCRTPWQLCKHLRKKLNEQKGAKAAA